MVGVTWGREEGGYVDIKRELGMGLVGYNLGGKRYSEGKLGVWVLGWLIGEGYHSKYRQEVRKIRKRDRS